MEIGINVHLSTADNTYHFDVFVNNKRHEGGVVEADNMSEAIEWINKNIVVELEKFKLT